MRKGWIVVLVVLSCVVTAYAFSSLDQKSWHSKLEKGEYRAAVEAVEEAPQNVYVIVSEPVQIFVATPDDIVFDGVELEHTDEEPEDTIAVENIAEELIEIELGESEEIGE